MPRGHDVRGLGRDGPRRVDPDHPQGARRRHQLHRHRRRLLARRVGGDRRQGACRRPPRQRRPRHQGARQDGRRPERVRQLAPLDRARGRQQPAPARHRLDRPLPDPPTRARHGHRRDARRAHRPRARGQGALHRLLDVPRERDRRGAVGGRAARPRALRLRAAAVLPAPSRDRGGRAADLPALRDGRHPVEPARRRLAVRQVAQGRRGPDLTAVGAGARPLRPLDSREPAQARRRRRARQARRRVRHQPDRDGAGVRDPPPRRDRGDHRAAHDRAPRVATARGRRRALGRAARQDRRDRADRASTSTRTTRAGRTRSSRRRPAGAS